MESLKVASLYCFTKLDLVSEKRDNIFRICKNLDVKGLIIMANEGINGTIAGEIKKVDIVIRNIKEIMNCDQINLKQSLIKEIPFGRIKVKIKKEIVTFGVDEMSMAEQPGIYVEPKDWNTLIRDENVVTIDTRNDYEVAIGSFIGAINPNTENFSDFPEWWRKNAKQYKGKSVAMFCTGGIRCEKSTKYLLKHGVRKVYHLKGGILNYLENYEGNESQWEGECFVFDQRVSVGSNIENGSCSLCFACRHPLRSYELNHPYYEEGVSCQHCYEKTGYERKRNFRERQKQIKLSALKGEKHLKYF